MRLLTTEMNMKGKQNGGEEENEAMKGGRSITGGQGVTQPCFEFCGAQWWTKQEKKGKVPGRRPTDGHTWTFESIMPDPFDTID